MSPDHPNLSNNRRRARHALRLHGFRLIIAAGLCQAVVLCCAQAAERDVAGGLFRPATPSQGGTKLGRLVSLPDAGQVTSIETHSFDNGLHQQIAFDGPNSFTQVDIKIITDSALIGGDSLAVEKPTRTGIAWELSKAAGGRSFQIVTRPMHNRYGPIGVAIFDRCIYAWQWIDDIRSYNLGLSVHSAAAEPLSLRIKHCHKLTQATDDLIADVERVTLTAGAAISSQTDRKLHRHNAFEQRRQGPDAGGALQTPADVTGQRYLAPQPETTHSTTGITLVPRPVQGNGITSDQRRFLTDGPAPAVAAPGQSTPPQPLSPDIPARAYQGPTPPPYGW
jgi:hypothetical protein